MSLLRLSFCGFFVGLVIASPSRAQDVLQWETDLARAQQTAAQTNRLVLVHFWGSWCPPCMRMEHEVFAKPGLGTALSPYFVPCKIQVEQGMNEALVKQFGVDVFPSDIVMTPQGQIVHRSKGFQSAERYVGMLQQTAQTALVQARPVAAGAPASQPPASAPAPVAPPSAAAPPPAATAPSAAVTTPSDDRYAYYYRGQNTSATPPSSPPPAPPTMPMPAAPTPATAPVVAAIPSDNRYADVRPAAPVTSPAAPAAAPSPIAPPVATPAIPPVAAAPAMPPAATAPAVVTPAVQTTITPAPAIAAKVDQPPPASNAATPAAPPVAAAAPKPPVGVGFQLPPGTPPLALDGYCPVTVTDKMVWKKGDVRFGAVHRGRTYLFASEEEQKKFLADPDHYSPIISGNDPVLALEKGESVPGKREFGLMCEKRMFLFSSKESYDKFCGDSKRYAGQIFQAMQAGDDVKRR